MYQRPTAHQIDPLTGEMSGASGRYEKRISDLEGLYADAAAFADRVAEDPDHVVYRVFEQRPAQAKGDLIFGTTWMEPGRIGAEYYMTRGHIQACTEAAQAAIAAMTAHRPEMIVGAGTVLTEAQVEAAHAAGAQFALSPILAAVLAHAAKIGLPLAPGIMTPSDLQLALRHGCGMVKFFPAMPAGRLNMLKDIAAPYAHTGIGFNPTSGVTLASLGEWLAQPEVRAVGGTWIASRADIAAGNWDKITRNAAEAVARLKELRAQ